MSSEKAIPSSGEGLAGWAHLQRGLGRTLLTWFLLLPVLSLVVAGVILSSIAIQNARQAALDRLSAIATLKQSEISAWVANRQEELNFIVASPSIRSKLLYVLDAPSPDPLVVATQDQLQAYFSSIASKGSVFEELFLLDASGRVLLSTDPSQIGTLHDQQAYFVEGRWGPYVQPPSYSLDMAAPSMVISQPVQDYAGRMLGVSAGRLNLGRLERVMEEESGLGRTGETYLVNATSLLVTVPRFGQGLTLGQELDTDGVKRGLALATSVSGEETGWSVYANYTGRRVLGVYRWMPKLQVVLLAEQEVSETLALTRGILASGLAMLLIVAGVAATVALLVSGRITRPLVGLTITANQLATGDLSREVPHTERQDEIGTLARAFSQMSQRLRELITRLEERVAERTRQWQEANFRLQRRAIQLEASGQVARAITSILNLDALLAQIVNLIRDRFGFYHAGIFLLEESGDWAVLRQATGEAGQRMLSRKHRLAVGGQSIVGWVTANRQPRVALDVGADAIHFKNPDLPHTRSEMALPLIVGDRLLGALDVQSIEEAAFDEEDVAILSLMADQIAVAIENALKFSQEATILEATSPLYRASRHLSMATDFDGVLRGIVDYVAGPHVDRCAINLFVAPTESQESGWIEVAAVWDRAEDSPGPPGTRYPMDRFKLVEYLRQEMAEPLVVNDLLAEVTDERLDDEMYRLLTETFHLRAVLILPLASAGRPLGLLAVASRQPHAWTEAELRTFRSLSDQAAIAVENARLLQRTQTLAERERTLSRMTAHFTRLLDIDTVLQTAVRELGQLPHVTEVSVHIAPPEEPFPTNGGEEG
jgi:GAF domain-containing protein/HAMP domain-containing protein